MYYLSRQKTLHAAAECVYFFRNPLVEEIGTKEAPEVVWDKLWRRRYGEEEIPYILADFPDVKVKVGCQQCLEKAAIGRGWVRNWPALDGNRRHK